MNDTAPSPLGLAHDPSDLVVDGVGLAVQYPAPRVALLQVCGELDALTCARFEHHALALLDERPGLIIDLSQVRFLGYNGLKVLISVRDAADVRRGQLRLVTGGHHTVVRAIKISGLDRFLRLHPDRDAALAALAPLC